ncbi:recombinase family protein [Paenibacillus sp. TRM 82003]|nr:recombinase family protein [Paenibacillus sp. TRM 82003]
MAGMMNTVRSVLNFVAIYVRVSTSKDSQKESPEHQTGICEEKARALGLEVCDHVYEDCGSATSMLERKEIQNLIRDAQEGRFQAVIFASLSRYARDTLDALTVKRMLVDMMGVRLISIEENYDSLLDKDELKFQIISAVNQRASESISHASRRGIRQSNKKGNYTGSFAPYGYKKAVVGVRKTLVPDLTTKHVVQLIFDLYTTKKMGIKSIVNYLNNHLGVPSPKGGIWGIGTIEKILQNEVYTGWNVFGKNQAVTVYNDISNMMDRSKKLVRTDPSKWERVKAHEAIINDETFQLAQYVRASRGGGKRGGVRNVANVFGGLIFCKHCGAAMVSTKSKAGKVEKSGLVYRYLICSARRRKGVKGCSNGAWISYNDLREAVLCMLGEKLKKAINVDLVAGAYVAKEEEKKHENVEAVSKKLEKEIGKRRKFLFGLRQQRLLGDIDHNQFQYEKELYEKEIAFYQAQLTNLPPSTAGKKDSGNSEVIQAALESLMELKFEHFDEEKIFMSNVIERVVLSEKGEIEIYTPLGGLGA